MHVGSPGDDFLLHFGVLCRRLVHFMCEGYHILANKDDENNSRNDATRRR